MHAHIIMSITQFSNILIPLIYTPFILFLTTESLDWGLIVMSVVDFKDLSLKYISLTCQWSHECGMNGKITPRRFCWLPLSPDLNLTLILSPRKPKAMGMSRQKINHFWVKWKRMNAIWMTSVPCTIWIVFFSFIWLSDLKAFWVILTSFIGKQRHMMMRSRGCMKKWSSRSRMKRTGYS